MVPIRLCGVSALVNNVTVAVALLPVRLGLDFAAAAAAAPRPPGQLLRNGELTSSHATHISMYPLYVWPSHGEEYGSTG